METVKKVFAGGCLMIVGCIGLVICIMAWDFINGANKPIKPVEQPAQVAINAQAKHSYLFQSPVDFQVAFNAFCEKEHIDFHIRPLTITEGDSQNVFAYQLTDILGLVGAVNKRDGSVTEIDMIATGDSTIKAANNAFTCITSLVAIIEPDKDREGNILKELHFGDKSLDITKMNSTAFKNGVKYSILSRENMGYWFFASSLN